ncbi:hypothetical protein BESB_055120 [Besnoitia besnoiti]|uniref:Magnesium transporter NIPA n=1 Tax=Besnoitia besnoiti TaxID=94643 RepID=A0A2A9MHX5_BESBE|nr:hypothetical protein BESB_055120 [Besnoitia besnoiti]PFH35861.1 hypothetical protein BESB_055120 [Besnoitia besnoiti]
MAISTTPSPHALVQYLVESCHSLHSTWYIGVILSIVSSFAGALGDNIVRLSYVKERGRGNTTRSLHQRPLWLLGTFLTVIVNPVLTIMALKFAAASIVLPFGGMHIFWNVILVGYLLREKLLPSDIIGSMCILFGIVIVIAYGAHEVPPYTLTSLSAMIAQPAFSVYLLAVFVCLAYCTLTSPIHTAACFVLSSLREDGGARSVWSDYAFSTGKGTTDSLRLLPTSAGPVTEPPLWLQRLTVSALSGVFGGLGNLSAKALIEILSSEGLAVCLQRYGFYLCCLATVLFCGSQLFYLNLALSRHEAKYVVPMVNSTLIASGSLGGILLFQEYANMSVPSIAAFSGGACSVVLGIMILAASSYSAVSKATQPEYVAQRMKELDGTDDERIALNAASQCSIPKMSPTF